MAANSGLVFGEYQLYESEEPVNKKENCGDSRRFSWGTSVVERGIGVNSIAGVLFLWES